MAKLPVVAIIGRPNVGKSTLFNRLVGRRQAIVSETPGTTRDHVAGRVDAEGVDYLLLDTGGIGGGSEDRDFEDDVAAQSVLALENADVILFAVNGREELTASDYAVADLLRKKRRRHVPVFLVVTKCDDTEKVDEALPRFYGLGVTDRVFPVSAVHGLKVETLQEAVASELRKMHFGKRARTEAVEGAPSFAEASEGKEGTEVPRVAIVGRPNSGKSSLVNALMSAEQRRISPRLTSPTPGTTRDSTDTLVRHGGREYCFIDTAGLRKQSRVGEGLEAFAVLRTFQAINEADVTVLVLDATREVGKQDKHIAGLAIEQGTGLVLLLNKGDRLDAAGRERVRQEMEQAFVFCRWAPVLLTSAMTRENLPHLFELIRGVHENRQRRIATPAVNRFFKEIAGAHPGMSGRAMPFKEVMQVGVSPPTFAIFLHDPKRLHPSSLRYLENRVREVFAFEGTPVRWVKKGGERERP